MKHEHERIYVMIVEPKLPPIMILIRAEVVSYYDVMHDMSFNDVLRGFVLDILICL
jgi:hypothetical protein